MFSHFYQLDLHNKNLSCISKPTLRHLQKSYENFDLPWFSYGQQQWMFVDSFIEQDT